MEKKPLILLVDDNPTNIQVLASLIAIKNYDIAVCNSGEKTLEFLEIRQPDLILMDIMMPGLSGIETCERIKNNSVWKDIPLLFISAKSDEDSIVEGFEAGGVDYITKPFLSLELIARVDTHLELTKVKKKLRDLSYTDDLTKAKNRRYFTKYLDNFIDHKLPKGESLSVILFDIDHFKDINDQYGHNVGDQALKRLSSLCHELIENRDALFCRIGGDEFAFTVCHTDKSEVTEFTDDLFKSIRENSGDPTLGTPAFTISAGVSQVTGQQRHHINVLAKVDKALYRAKENGRNCFCFN